MQVKDLIQSLQDNYKPDDEIVCDIWGAEDVRGFFKESYPTHEELTDDQINDVLGTVEHNKDANRGISWASILEAFDGII